MVPVTVPFWEMVVPAVTFPFTTAPGSPPDEACRMTFPWVDRTSPFTVDPVWRVIVPLLKIRLTLVAPPAVYGPWLESKLSTSELLLPTVTLFSPTRPRR